MNGNKIFKQNYSKNYKDIDSNVFEDTIKDILRYTQERLKKKNYDLKVLDVGSGRGLYSFALAKKVKKVVGVEPHIELYKKAVKNNFFSNVIFIPSKIEDFQTNEQFDLVLSLTTIEHMPDAKASFDRIFNLLKSGGIIYITAPNKLWPFDYHYRLLFITYLPLRIANLYMRAMRRGTSFEDSCHAKTYFGMKKFLRSYPCQFKFILPDPNSSYLGCGHEGPKSQIIKKLGIKLIQRFPFLWLISKGFIVLVQKNK